ncbi:Asp-tRNA(Asn)/Glu-tRNA(Gln) amidotransferase subunit GatC [Candidatus Curtissbacteria bacterium]|nr:Asp-tRNA(Asn)/Glu-tRNA(Gln) amidotransferase subunit GatC [Candidatus Curtissbacteria bacterium]
MKIDIAHVAKLANLKLTPKEEKDFEKQLSAILDYFKDLQKLNTEKVEPISNITGLQNVSREDEPKPSLSQEDALKNAPKIHNGFFEVDAIFQENE